MKQLIDKYGRKISYLRLAVTDRCNLRCQYCMPEHGIDIVPRKELLTFKEMYRITRVLSELGVDKVRLTGGEPFVRKDFIKFVDSLSFNKNLREINITTNGAQVSNHIEALERMNVKSVNLSIDTLNSQRFFEITKRNVFPKVLESYQKLLRSDLNLKLNVVIQPGVNTDEINDFIELTKKDKVSVRFIEEMPFNGKGLRPVGETWNYDKILSTIRNQYGDITALESEKSSTSKNFKVKEYVGSFGIIPAFTRTICNDCNRIRITATGLFKNCLFDDGVFNIRDFLRNGASDEEIRQLFISTVQQKPVNGFVAEANRKSLNIKESMSTIGG